MTLSVGAHGTAHLPHDGEPEHRGYGQENYLAWSPLCTIPMSQCLTTRPRVQKVSKHSTMAPLIAAYSANT